MFSIEENDFDPISMMIEDMLYIGGIMIEQDCVDLRPMLRTIIESSHSDFFIIIGTYAIVYTARETNNWRTWLTTQIVEEFFADFVEDMANNLVMLMRKCNKPFDDDVREFYSFMAERFISAYDP